MVRKSFNLSFPKQCCRRMPNIFCLCDSRYVGGTSQRLQDRIRQHVPNFITTGQIPNFCNIFTRFSKFSTPVMFSESAIDQQLLDNSMCAKNYSDKKLL